MARTPAIAQSYAVNTRRNRWVFAGRTIAQIWAAPAAQMLQDALAACESIPDELEAGALPLAAQTTKLGSQPAQQVQKRPTHRSAGYGTATAR